jgi:L-amino acid N-acyltransferase YncA
MGMKGVEIRPWRAADRDRIRELMREHLEEVDGGAGDFIPDEHNVNAMTDLGLTWAEAGEPSLVACRNSVPVGFVLAGPIVSPLHLRDRLLHYIANHVCRKERGNRISNLLNEKLAAEAEAAGYDRIETVAFDQRGWHCLQEAGFEIRGYLVKKRLKQQTKRAA